MTFGEKVKALRWEKQLNQEQLGKALEVSHNTVGKWERGITVPKMPHLKKLCEYFDIPIEELWNDEIDI